MLTSTLCNGHVFFFQELVSHIVRRFQTNLHANCNIKFQTTSSWVIHSHLYSNNFHQGLVKEGQSWRHRHSRDRSPPQTRELQLSNSVYPDWTGRLVGHIVIHVCYIGTEKPLTILTLYLLALRLAVFAERVFITQMLQQRTRHYCMITYRYYRCYITYYTNKLNEPP